MLSVLIVEDSALVRARLGELIVEIPRLVIAGEYDNAPDAIGALQQHGADIVLLDIKLKASDGLSILRDLRAALTHTKFIVFTNHTEDAYRNLFDRYGADYFFSKTHETEQLRETLIALAASSAGGAHTE
jgi:DNA-binding NarL/FixJ family response regulator